MAIPISEYIDVASVVVADNGASRNFSGLVFTTDAMKASTGALDPYATEKANYAAGKVVSLSKDGITACFESTSDIAVFATKYFGYANLSGRTPSVLNVFKVATSTAANAELGEQHFTEEGASVALTKSTFISKAGSNYGTHKFMYDGSSWKAGLAVVDLEEYGLVVTGTATSGDWFEVVYTDGTVADTALTAFKNAMANFSSFGAFTFLGNNWTVDVKATGGLKDVANKNKAYGYHYTLVVPVTTANYSAITADDALGGIGGVHFVLGNPESGKTNMAAWMALAFAGSANYDTDGTPGTMDFKNFEGEAATVTTKELKDNLDIVHVNYVGVVQTRGVERKFYQQGANADGMDFGVYLDASWMSSYIESAYLNLATGSKRISANTAGVTSVRAILLNACSTGLKNGSIIVDKPLTANQQNEIKTYAGNDSAVTAVQTNGYYVSCSLSKQKDRYLVSYVVVYAKGDHVGKVEGTHYIV